MCFVSLQLYWSGLMAFTITSRDHKLLVALAEYRLVTARQVVILQGKSKEVVWRRLRGLANGGLVSMQKRQFGRGRGRPENVLSLTELGIDYMRDQKLISPKVAYEDIMTESISCPDHQLLMNWFRIHLVQIERFLGSSRIQFLAYNSPYMQKGSGNKTQIYDYVPGNNTQDREIAFSPDGVFTFTNEVQMKTLLFFLEVDMGTETIASPLREKGDIRQKIVNYQAYFRSLGYKRYEQVWNCPLNGFRLLFLANTQGRLANLCRLVQEMPPSDFIWLTEQGQMFADGVASEIWARGGKLETPQESILGSLCCRIPIDLAS
jgi:hypothetical protein